ncbi:MAG: histidine phosphotransferase family protein, partial [Bdellovibrionales bacterium]
MPDINVRVLELLLSKVAHDLISPIGAVNNGVEFVQEMGLEDSGDAFDLIAFSAQQAAAKLKAYRMAYGAGGADNSIKPDNVYDIVEAMVAPDGKIKQDWDKDAPFGLNPDTYERPLGFGKILICGFLLAMDSLPKGGTLSLHDDGPQTLIITAKGEDTGFRDNIEAALSLTLSQDNLEPKYIHPYVTALLCKHYGFKISTDVVS